MWTRAVAQFAWCMATNTQTRLLRACIVTCSLFCQQETSSEKAVNQTSTVMSRNSFSNQQDASEEELEFGKSKVHLLCCNILDTSAWPSSMVWHQCLHLSERCSRLWFCMPVGQNTESLTNTWSSPCFHWGFKLAHLTWRQWVVSSTHCVFVQQAPHGRLPDVINT